MRSRRPFYVALVCFALAIVALGGTLIQAGVFAGDAQAQSSVNPPENAVNVQNTSGSSVRPPSNAVTNAPMEPGVQRVPDVRGDINPAKADTLLATQGPNSASTIWGEIRAGETFTVSIPDPQAAFLVQDEGMGWLAWRAKGGPLQVYGG